MTLSQSSSTNPVSLNFSLPLDPARITRAYLRYKAKNIFSPAALAKSINSGAFYGGTTAIAGKSADTGRSINYIEEINPADLVSGANIIQLYTPNANVSLSEVECLYAVSNGWNSVGDMTSRAMIDGDGTTYTPLPFDTAGITVPLERYIIPETILLNVTTPFTGTVAIQAETSDGWNEIPGCRIQGDNLINGWNTLTPASPVAAQNLRIVCVEYPSDTSTDSELHINEFRVQGSSIGAAIPVPSLVMSYPRNGEYLGRRAYLGGFVKGKRAAGSYPKISYCSSSYATLPSNGSFFTIISKDSAGYGSQGDDDAWEVPLEAYDAEGYVSKTVSLSQNLLSTSMATGSVSTSTGTGTSGTSSSGGVAVTVTPDKSASVALGNVTLTIPAGAVSATTKITIIPLSKSDLKTLTTGMTNVTAGAAGYRFLPHGSFKKNVTVSFSYDPTQLSSSMKDEAVYMYYYNDTTLRWERLVRSSLEKTKALVYSQTDHFTDIINATLAVPEHPDAMSYNPNSIKDIKAADPTSRVNLIDAPQASYTGDASVSYPLDLPKGRGGMQPQLAVRYSSAGNNGWLGQGWDISVQSISVDTKYGVPRYDGTETYLLEGTQLEKISGEIYRPRVEGSFNRIRFVSGSYWEVTDKNGTKSYYGRDAVSRVSDPANAAHIFQWNLQQVTDVHGNTITYSYDRKQSLDGGYQLYLSSINYTGTNGGSGPYTVTFTLDDGATRADRISSYRSGFKIDNNYRLSTITVSYGSMPVRSYMLSYVTGEFAKSLLSGIHQYGASGTLFNEHTFQYYDDIVPDSGSGTKLYPDSPVSWGNILNNSIGGSHSKGSERSKYDGYIFSLYNLMKSQSFGPQNAHGSSVDHQQYNLIDMNGDGLPDQVYVSDKKFFCRLNLSNSGTNGFGEEIPIEGISGDELSRTKGTTANNGTFYGMILYARVRLHGGWNDNHQ